MTTETMTVSLTDVIDTVVEEFVANADGPFDKRRVELRILGTPEFRRIHDVQVKYLEDIDIEAPIFSYMKDRVRYTLSKMRNSRGERSLQAIADRGRGGQYTWYPLFKLNARLMGVLMAQWTETRDACNAKIAVGNKLLAALKAAGPDAVVGDVYEAVLSADDKAALHSDDPEAGIMHTEDEAAV